MVNLLFYIYFILLLFSLARRGRPPLFAPRLPWGREVLSRPGMLQPQPRDAETLSLFLQPPERRETPALQRELGKRVPTAACGEPSIKRVTPAPLCVRKEGEGGGEKQGKKKKKNSPNKHWDRTATARGPEKSRGPGSSTKDGAGPLPAPSHPGLSVPSARRPPAASGLVPSREGSRCLRDRIPVPGARLRSVGSSRSGKNARMSPMRQRIAVSRRGSRAEPRHPETDSGRKILRGLRKGTFTILRGFV